MDGIPEEFSGLDRDALLAELDKARSELEDAEAMCRFVLAQIGVHLGARQLKAMQTTWVRDEERLRERIAAIESILAKWPERGQGERATP